MTSTAKTFPPIGFFTIVERSDVGFTGGYLVLNAAGRPLEFHCTTPLRPNRSQEILYGPTLRSYVVGEQIGQALVAKSALQPLFVCTDILDGLSLNELVSFPVLLVDDADSSQIERETGSPTRIDSAHRPSGVPMSNSSVAGPHVKKRIGNRELVIQGGQVSSWEQASKVFSPFADSLDLLEPFNRIREAIDEIQKSSK